MTLKHSLLPGTPPKKNPLSIHTPLSYQQDPCTLRLSAFDLSSSRGASKVASKVTTPVHLGAPLSAAAAREIMTLS